MVVAAPTALENADIVAGLLGDVPWDEPRAFVSEADLFFQRSSAPISNNTGEKRIWSRSAKGKKQILRGELCCRDATYLFECDTKKEIRRKQTKASLEHRSITTKGVKSRQPHTLLIDHILLTRLIYVKRVNI